MKHEILDDVRPLHGLPRTARPAATDGSLTVRTARADEVDHLAALWHDVWHESHAPLMPADLTALRTLDSFRDRIRARLPDVRLVARDGVPVGFSIVRGDELYQLFVSRESRASGVAAVLLLDVEARMAEQGVAVAWLACAIGNERAARFYEKHGWRRAGVMVNYAETSARPYRLEVWRYEKALASGIVHRGASAPMVDDRGHQQPGQREGRPSSHAGWRS